MIGIRIIRSIRSVSNLDNLNLKINVFFGCGQVKLALKRECPAGLEPLTKAKIAKNMLK